MKKITIIGTGYVGLVSGAGLAEFGHSVSCVDIDQEKIKNLNNGQIPIHEPGLDIIVKNNVKEGRLTFSSNIEKNIQEAKIIFIAVGTPQDEKGIADLTAVKSIVKLIADNLIKEFRNFLPVSFFSVCLSLGKLQRVAIPDIHSLVIFGIEILGQCGTVEDRFRRPHRSSAVCLHLCPELVWVNLLGSKFPASSE